LNRGLNRNQIKYIAIAAMLVDHIAWLFVRPFTPLWEIMHFIGRITGPTMAVFIAEGCRYTKDINRYTLRLGIFALISWPCFSLMETGRITAQFGVIYTLFLSLLALRVWDAKCHIVIKLLCIGALLYLSSYGDWSYYDIIYALIAHIFFEKKELRWGLHTLVAVIDIVILEQSAMSYGYPWWAYSLELGVLLPPLIFFFFYNGQPGSKKTVHKWFFYVFYPLHMLVLWYIKYMI